MLMRKCFLFVEDGACSLRNKANVSSRGDLGAKVYLMFAGCMLLNLIICYFVFPELKGRTAAEVDEMFEARLPARKFKGTPLLMFMTVLILC